MLHLTSSEQRQRSHQFDVFVESGLEVLGNPNVAQHFSPLDVETLNQLLGTAILPNVNHAKISVPTSKLLQYSPVVLPADRVLYPKATEVAYRSPTWRLFSRVYEGTDTYSPRYQQTYARVAQIQPVESSVASEVEPDITPPQRHPGEMAHTSTRSYPPLKPGGRFAQERPLVTFRTELLEESRDFVGSIALHEAIHCQDFAEHGPVESLHFSVATELRAYQAGCFVADAYEQTAEQAHVARQVEKQRQKRATAVSQFVVDQSLTSWMVKRQLVI